MDSRISLSVFFSPLLLFAAFKNIGATEEEGAAVPFDRLGFARAGFTSSSSESAVRSPSLVMSTRTTLLVRGLISSDCELLYELVILSESKLLTYRTDLLTKLELKKSILVSLKK